MTTTLTIGQNAEIYSYYTKQRRYGRQSLYVELKRNDVPFDIHNSFIQNVYVMDVFPNISEHFERDYYLSEYSCYNEDKECYTRESGEGEYTEAQLFKTTTDLLNAAIEGKEFEIEIEEETE